MSPTIYKINIKDPLHSTGNLLTILKQPIMGKNLKMNIYIHIYIGFPNSSAGKESTCSAGDPSSIPGLGRSTGEGIDNPIQYSRASLEAQLVKNLPASWETWIPSLGWEDPL